METQMWLKWISGAAIFLLGIALLFFPQSHTLAPFLIGLGGSYTLMVLNHDNKTTNYRKRK